MSYRLALRRLKQLSPEQKETLRSHSIAGKKSLRVWLRQLRGIGEFDSLRDKAMRSLGWTTALMVGLLIVSVIFVLNISSDSPYVTPALVGIVVLVLAILWLFSTLFKLKSLDVPNSVRELVYPFLRVLAVETSYLNKADLKLELRNRLNLKNKVFGPALMKNPLAGRIKPTETRFEHSWLRLGTTLADKSKFELGITERVRQVSFSKRASRGRIKRKTKYAVIVKIQTSFLPPGKTEWIQLSRRIKSKDLDFMPPLDALLGLISEYYQQYPPTKGHS